MKPTLSSFLISCDEEANRSKSSFLGLPISLTLFCHLRVKFAAFVNEAHRSSLNAKEWIDYCSGMLEGGKGGGKPTQANGTAPLAQDSVAKLIESAQMYLRNLGLEAFVSRESQSQG